MRGGDSALPEAIAFSLARRYLCWARDRTQQQRSGSLLAVFQVLLVLGFLDTAHFAWPISCELKSINNDFNSLFSTDTNNASGQCDGAPGR